MYKENVRGKLKYKGITGEFYDTISGQIKVVIFLIFSIALMITFTYCTIIFKWTLIGSSIFGATIWIFFMIIFIILLHAGGGIEINGIYELGISSAMHNLGDCLMKKTFHRYENITKIGYGNHTFTGGLKTSFISIYENNENEPSAPAFHKYRFKNDFYNKLIKTLKQKCPNAKWVKIEYASLPFTKK